MLGSGAWIRRAPDQAGGCCWGSGVTGAFLLPAWFQRRSRRRHPSRPAGAAARSPAKKPPAPLVMLDPGHGGKDPGAIGVSGTYEKNIALAAASELRRLLEAGGHYRVELTRTRDVFIPLDERVARAQARGAALFVSMHADAVSDHSVRGASVYTLSTTASDAQTAALAQRENSADRYGGPGFKEPRPRSRRSSPAWSGRRPGWGRPGWRAAWSGSSTPT